MSISVFQAAKRLGSCSNWNLSNLQMQKILYFAHMIHLGRRDAPLIDETFEAWEYGPVMPSLYRKIKFFGSDKVIDIFPSQADAKGREETEIIREVADFFKDKKPHDLVTIAHHPKGAWAKNYNSLRRNIKIPNADIQEEYNNLYR